jgi:hypothetical protein
MTLLLSIVRQFLKKLTKVFISRMQITQNLCVKEHQKTRVRRDWLRITHTFFYLQECVPAPVETEMFRIICDEFVDVSLTLFPPLRHYTCSEL